MAVYMKQALLRTGTKWRFFIPLRCSSDEPKDYFNFPESYVKREMEDIEWETPKGPQYLRKVIKNRRYNYSMSRPWESEAKDLNKRGKKVKKVWVEPLKYWTIFRGDRVEILVGRDKGKQGIVNDLVKERNWVTVLGLNCEYKFQGKTKDYPGMLAKFEKPLLVTNEVSLIDPSDNKPTTVEWRYTEEGERVRVSARTGRIIPMPIMADETYDYKAKETYPEQPKDTKSKQVSEITFNPKLMTFEMEIMKEMNIKEDRIPAKLFWY